MASEPNDTAPVALERPSSVRTPFYRASNASRYDRQDLIRSIQEATDSRLICYVGGRAALINRDDVLPLVDLFHVVPSGSNIDLLLHTPGGDIDAAEKMASMLRKRVGHNARLRVIVPDYAKSAGTLIALAADTIIMSDSSELGPVDPQLFLPDGRGGMNQRPAQSYVDGYEGLVDLVNREPDSSGYKQMLDKYDPTTLDLCRKVLERSTKLGEELLRAGMFRDGGNWTKVAGELSNNRKWLWHGVPIDREEAERLELHVTYLPPSDELWQQYWNLYCRQRLSLPTDDSKLFESDYVSLPLS